MVRGTGWPHFTTGAGNFTSVNEKSGADPAGNRKVYKNRGAAARAFVRNLPIDRRVAALYNLL